MVEYRIDRPPADCYAAFNQHEQMRLWLPDLKRLKVVSTDERGRLKEAVYEMGESLTFALVYAYDDASQRVRWVPSAGVRDGVSGYASFEAEAGGGGGTRFTYA